VQLGVFDELGFRRASRFDVRRLDLKKCHDAVDVGRRLGRRRIREGLHGRGPVELLAVPEKDAHARLVQGSKFKIQS